MSALDLASIFSSSSRSTLRTTASTAARTDAGALSTGADFASSLSLRLAEFEAQTMGLLFGTDDDKKSTSIFDLIGGTASNTSGADDIFSLLGSASTSQTASDGQSVNGRNMSLADPQAAYRMMSFINSSEVNFKAQFAELSEMKNAVGELQQTGQALGGVSTDSDDAAIVAQLQAFADQYNAWITRFDATVQDNGVLAGTRAAEVSLYELEQSIENDFNGATHGFHGLDDLGLTINETTNLATLDIDALSSALASNKNGVVSTVQQFSAQFAKSAELLTSSDNFLVNRLDNLDRAIDFIADNESSLQAEFGLGDAAKPSPQTAKALATYEQIYSS